MVEIISTIHTIFSSSLFLLCIKIIGFFVQAYVLGLLIRNLIVKEKKRLWLLIISSITSTLIIDANWIVKLLNKTGLIPINFTFIALFCQIGYPFDLLRYICLIIFLDLLVRKKIHLNLWWFYFISASIITIICTLLLYEFCHFNNPFLYRTVSSICYALIYFYLIIALIPALTSIFITIKKVELPQILHRQIDILIIYLAMPHIAFELVTTNPFTFFTATPLRSNYFLISMSAIQLALALYYCTKRVTLLRFLNTRKQVNSLKKINFIKDFKNVLDALSSITTLQDLNSVTQIFFTSAFGISPEFVQIFARFDDTQSNNYAIEEFLANTDHDAIKNSIYAEKIIIFDLLEFSQFFEKTKLQEQLLTFLTKTNITIFLPLYDKQVLIGYIIVYKNPIQSPLIGLNKTEMILFAGYVATILNNLRTKKINTLLKHNKDLAEEVYNKQQEIAQYKESIRSFILESHEESFGIIFYKEGAISYATQYARTIFQNDINVLEKSLNKLAHTTLLTKKPQTSFYPEKKLTIYAVPSDNTSVIFIAYYHDATDILALQKKKLCDPSHIDYLLYLETTRSGQLINRIIPASDDASLQFKINLLRMALSHKTILLDMPQEELLPAVEILHNISLRSKLHVLTLIEPEINFSVAFMLFGADPLFSATPQEPLLKQLDGIGTLFIENIHFLHKETQDLLAQFLIYGFFYIFKTNKKIFSNVRIICSMPVTIPLDSLSKKLVIEIDKSVLSLPSFITLSHTELNDLVYNYQNSLSIKQFKELIQKRIHITETTIYHEVATSISSSDKSIAHAIKLGKKALKDEHLMLLLWNTFKNQSKIATLLGVNRSSINRRLKDYRITG